MSVSLIGPSRRGGGGASSSSPWFLGAPVTKAVGVCAAVGYVACETTKLTDGDLGLDAEKILNEGQYHRLFLSNLTFGTVGELIFGLAVLCPLSRRFEREMGSRRYGTFLLYVNVLSAILILTLSPLILSELSSSSTDASIVRPGPLPLLGALLHLYRKYTPRLHPKFIGALGFDFSEKAVAYFFALQAIFSGGWGTFLPVTFGAMAGAAVTSVGMYEWEMPQFAYALAGAAGGGLVDEDGGSQIAISRRHAGGAAAAGAGADARGPRAGPGPTAGGGAGAGAAMGAPGGGGGFEVPPSPPPPSEDAIAQLTAMGFDRDAVVRALGHSDNNVEMAANRLLSGGA
uniref:UBA domain-containing protein n=1 Tax=Trieres chinensis TaxID=1514140 RepID=A0A7S1ZHX3_TRICV